MADLGRVAIVTGGGSGIGRAVCLALANDGFHVVIAGRRGALLEETARLVSTPVGRVLPIVTDVTQPASVKNLFAKTRETFGRLDVLFNNAGVTAPPVPLEEITYEQWQAVVDTNLTGTFLCTQEALRLMKSQEPRGGRIINNGSVSAYSPRPNSAPYTATKHAVLGLTKATSLDGRNFDVACGQIDIGNAVTEMSEGLARGARQASGAIIPEPRFDVDHVARAVLYMANLPLDANVQYMTVMATKMPFIGRG